MNQYDRIYNILIDSPELEEGKRLKKALTAVALTAAAAGGGRHLHRTLSTGPKPPTPVSITNVNHPDYIPQNPTEAEAIERHKKDAAGRPRRGSRISHPRSGDK